MKDMEALIRTGVGDSEVFDEEASRELCRGMPLHAIASFIPVGDDYYEQVEKSLEGIGCLADN